MRVTGPTETTDNLSGSRFHVIVYGREDDPTVRELAEQMQGMALQDPEREIKLRTRKIALLRHTSEHGDAFADFVSRFVANNISHIYELRVINGFNGLPPDEDDRRRPKDGG